MGAFFSMAGDINKATAEGHMADIYERQGKTAQDVQSLAAADAVRRGVQQAGVVDMKAGQLRGAESAGYAASGVDAGSGSAAQTQADTETMSQYSKDIITNNAARESWGYQVKGMQAYQQGELNAYGARQGQQAAQLQTAGDGVQGGMQVVSTFLTMGAAAGAFGGSK